MSSSRSRHPLLPQELINYSLSSTPLQEVLQQVIEELNAAQSETKSAETKEKSHYEELAAALGKLKKENADEHAAITAQLNQADAWSERFTALEAKYFSMSDEVLHRMEDLQKEIHVKFIEAGADADRSIRLLSKDLAAKLSECEESVFQMRLDLKSLETRKDVGSPYVNLSSTEAAASPAHSSREESNGEEKRTVAAEPRETFPAQPVDPDPHSALLEKLESRISALERTKKSHTTIPQKSTPLSISNIDEEVETRLRAEFSAELANTQQHTEQRLEALKAAFTAAVDELIAQIPVPQEPLEQVDLTAIYERLDALEAAVSAPVVTTISPVPILSGESSKMQSAHMSPTAQYIPMTFQPAAPLAFQPASQRSSTQMTLPISAQQVSQSQASTQTSPHGVEVSIPPTVLRELAQLRQSVEALEHKTSAERDIAHLKSVVASLREDVQGLSRNFNRMKVRQSISIEESPVIARFTNSPSGAQMSTEFNATIPNEKLLSMRHASIVPLSPVPDPMPQIESRFSAMQHDIEKLNLELAARDREIDDMNQHFERMDRIFSGAVQRVQDEVNQKVMGIQEMLDRPADNPDTSKNLSALRGVILKLQRDLRSLTGAVMSQQVAPIEETLASVPKDDRTAENHIKVITTYLQKHEGQIRAFEGTMRQLMKDMDSLNLYVKKTADMQNLSRLSEMEKFRTEVEVVITKVMDGVKLNKRDYEKMSELYAQLETKGDKAELARKVDKVELRKAYAALSKKIEKYREDVRKSQEAPTSPPPAKEEVAACTTRRLLDLGCLSCGQEVQSPETEPDIRHSHTGHYPGRGLHMYGHGFSKLLPIISDIVTPEHKRVGSDTLQFSTTSERRKRKLRTLEATRGHCSNGCFSPLV